MTDKQIIDGIDVSGCMYFTKITAFQNNCIINAFADCSKKPNCYYKQFKRKEQECEKAKQNAQDTYDLWRALIESFNILQGEKIKLEQECEELKDKLNCRFCYPIMKIDDPENFKLCQETDCFRRQLDKLKQTLAEIKEIAESEMDSKEFMTVQCMLNGSVDNKNKVLKQIIQKINEVEDEYTGKN